MTATNHALSGALVGLTISQPLTALPLAFISHFVLDAVPHFGVPTYQERRKHKKFFHFYSIIDFMLVGLLLAFLTANNVSSLIYLCMLVAFLPDMVWIYRYSIKEGFGKKPFQPMGRFATFHKKIQWSETFVPGIYVELTYAAVAFFVTLKLL